MSVLDRIRKLIALAASDNENEARNAAYLAAKLIREHKVTLKLPGRARDEEEPSSSLEDLWNEVMSRRPRAARPQAPLDDPTDEGAFFSRPPKRKPRKPDPTDEELNDIFKAEPLDDELKDLFERAEKKR